MLLREGGLPGCKYLRRLTLAHLTPSPLHLHETQSRPLCSVQAPCCLLAKLGMAQQTLHCAFFSSPFPAGFSGNGLRDLAWLDAGDKSSEWVKNNLPIL